MANEITLYSVNDIRSMSEAIAKSGLFGMKKPEEAMALMLIAQAEGQHPALAARDYNIIQGKPAMKADAMLARFQSAGGKVEWHVLSDTECSASFTHPAGGTAKITWTMEDAKRAGFASKDNWRKFPRPMLRSRVVSEGIRTVFPGVSVGVYTPEEVQDFDEKKGNVTIEGTTTETHGVEVIGGPVIDEQAAKDIAADFPEYVSVFKDSQERKAFMIEVKEKLSKAETEDDIHSLLDEHGGKFKHLGHAQRKAMNDLFNEALAQFGTITQAG